jgi:hypothetical protein
VERKIFPKVVVKTYFLPPLRLIFFFHSESEPGIVERQLQPSRSAPTILLSNQSDVHPAVVEWVEDPVVKRSDAQDAVVALVRRCQRILVAVHPKIQVEVHLALVRRRLPGR